MIYTNGFIWAHCLISLFLIWMFVRFRIKDVAIIFHLTALIFTAKIFIGCSMCAYFLPAFWTATHVFCFTLQICMWVHVCLRIKDKRLGLNFWLMLKHEEIFILPSLIFILIIIGIATKDFLIPWNLDPFDFVDAVADWIEPGTQVPFLIATPDEFWIIFSPSDSIVINFFWSLMLFTVVYCATLELLHLFLKFTGDPNTEEFALYVERTQTFGMILILFLHLGGFAYLILMKLFLYMFGIQLL